jgi:hypothetical protein
LERTNCFIEASQHGCGRSGRLRAALAKHH